MSEKRASVGRGMAPALIVLAFAVVYVPWAYSYGPRGELVPALTGWLLVGLSLLDILAHTDTALGRTLYQLLSGRAMDAGTDDLATTYPVGRQIGAMLWMAGFVAAVSLIGFLVTVPVYVFAFMRVQGRKPFRHCILAAAVITVVVWLAFEVLLRYDVYPGILFGG